MNNEEIKKYLKIMYDNRINKYSINKKSKCTCIKDDCDGVDGYICYVCFMIHFKMSMSINDIKNKLNYNR